MKVLPTASNYADAKTVDSPFKAGMMLCMDMTDMKLKDKCEQPREMPCSGGQHQPEAPKVMYYTVEMPMTPNNKAELKNGLWFTTTDATGYEVADVFAVGESACLDTDGKLKKKCVEPAGPTDPNTPPTAPKVYHLTAMIPAGSPVHVDESSMSLMPGDTASAFTACEVLLPGDSAVLSDKCFKKYIMPTPTPHVQPMYYEVDTKMQKGDMVMLNSVGKISLAPAAAGAVAANSFRLTDDVDINDKVCLHYDSMTAVPYVDPATQPAQPNKSYKVTIAFADKTFVKLDPNMSGWVPSATATEAGAYVVCGDLPIDTYAMIVNVAGADCVAPAPAPTPTQPTQPVDGVMYNVMVGGNAYIKAGLWAKYENNMLISDPNGCVTCGSYQVGENDLAPGSSACLDLKDNKLRMTCVQPHGFPMGAPTPTRYQKYQSYAEFQTAICAADAGKFCRGG
jgi:hypothetical protein